MRNLFRPFLLAALAAAVLGSSGCSESTTTPRVTAPYPNAEILVTGATLAANLSAANQVIVDTRAADAYAAGHVPNAINLPISPGSGTFDIGGNGPDRTDLKPAGDIALVLGAAGIAENTTLVVYGTDMDWLVGRMFWMLEYLGATDVRMLDGGFVKWTADGRQVSTVTPVPEPRTFTPTVVPALLVDKSDILAAYANTDEYVIVDSRNAVDYQVSRIPNAVNILIQDFLNPDFTMRAAVEIEALLDARGVTPDKTVYTHCYVGYRSSQEYFVFRLMDYNVSHYDGSWADWSADPNTPKEP
jgi:3-mercaptopyruvate sulfurtransferase SseA